MDDFKSQYEQELKLQEINSNKHILKGFIWFLSALGLVWLLTITGFFDVNKYLVTIAFFATLIMFIPPLCIFFKGDLSNPKLKYYFLSLICVVSAVIISVLTVHAVLLYVIPLLYAIQYRKSRIIWFVYLINTFTMLISSIIGFYYGICDLNILLESQHVRAWYLELLADGSFKIPFNEKPLFIIVVFEVFPRSIILFVFSIMMHYTVSSSNRDAFKIAQLTYLKETDTRTKAFNKNKYEEMLAEYYPKIDRVAVMFWDMNDLKRINDLHGHATGDKAIDKLCRILHDYASPRCRIYRIGGDEFVMIIDNPKLNEAENIIATAKEKIELANKHEQIKLSSAVGLAYGRGDSIDGVIAKADARMYKDKKKCKENIVQ
ncbi:MAG: diguanylate cyclase [Lachnospiraceae bacterium]|nr:diguanylate cyclase [Lachnospiraceae bacterium]